jgi:hypothetical protein
MGMYVFGFCSENVARSEFRKTPPGSSGSVNPIDG